MKPTQKYIDLDIGFSLNPLTDDVGKKVNGNAIKQSLKSLILMDKYDRPFYPQMGSQIKSMLFENMTPVTKASIKRLITYTVENFEPRVKLISVDVNQSIDSNSVVVTLTYNIVNIDVVQNLSITINRLR